MADKVSGFLNFLRWMFNDEFGVQKPTDDVPRQLIMPGSGASAYYQNLDTNFGVGSSWLKEYLVVENDLISRYIDYEDMDDYPEMASALDIYADDATQPDGISGKSLKVECADETLSQVLSDLYDENLRIEEDLWEITRSLCKYGNDFEEIVVRDGEGVVDLNFLPAPTVRRIEDTEGGLLGFLQDYTVNFRISNDEFLSRISDRSLEHENVVEATIRSGLPVRTFENWEVVHFRLRSKHRRAMYGFGMLENVRFLFKRMLLLEDSMLMYRLTRAPERLAFYIDVGNVPPNEAMAYVKKVKNEYKKRKWVDPRTGKLDLSFNPLCISFDTRIPLLDGSTKTLRQLISDYEAGIKNFVYSIDRKTKRIVPGEVIWAGETRKEAELVKVTLDNCREEIVTPDHKFLLRNGEYKEAKDLQPGDSLMPFNRGINSTGYEYVVHPGETSWDCIEATHRMVARSFSENIAGMEVHHIDNHKKRDNRPFCLEVLTPAEHAQRHAEDKANRFRTWNKTEAHSHQVSENNIKYNKGLNIVHYNNSDKHAQDNEIRSQSLKRIFVERYNDMCAAMRIKFPGELEEFLKQKVVEQPAIKVDDLCGLVMADDEIFELFKAHNTREIKNIHRHMLLAGLRQFGYSDFKNFKKQVLHNHKVVSVEFLSYRENTGCITVKDWHNFALESGIFIKNSADEDYFIPVRNDKRAASIERIDGANYQGVDDINYFKDKMYTGVKIPKDYLNYSENTPEGNLSQKDMRFARTILRIQRIIRNGCKQIGRVHLAALGTNPDIVPWEVLMNPPSSVFELAQMEVRNAQLDLAERYKAFASQYWIMRNLLHLTDEEIKEINDQRKNEYLDQTRYPNFESKSTPNGLHEKNFPKFFFEGNQNSEKFLKSHWNDIMSKDPVMKKRFDELRALMFDLKGAVARISR